MSTSASPAPTLGVQMFTLRKYTQTLTELNHALEKVRRIGYRSIQISAFGAMPAADIAHLCTAHDLTVTGTHVSWERLQSDLPAVIEEHQLWGCEHTAVGMIDPTRYLSLAGLDQFLQELMPVEQGLRAAGIDFSYHHHAHEFLHFDHKPWLSHLIERTTQAQLKLELDTHWVVAGGADPAAWIERCGARMPLLHLKDFCLSSDYKRRFAAIGEGNLNWPVILERAAHQPIKHYFVEQDSCYGEDEFDCLDRSYQFLNKFGLT